MVLNGAEAHPEQPEELIQRGAKRREKRDAAVIKAGGVGAGDAGRRITERCLPDLIAGLDAFFSTPHPGKSALHTFLRQAAQLERPKLALCLLLGAIEGIAEEKNLLKTALQIGTYVRVECYVAGILKEYGDKDDQSRRDARRMFITKRWKRKALAIAGTWGIDQLLEFLPGIFETAEEQRTKNIAEALRANNKLASRSPDKQAKKNNYKLKPEKFLYLTTEAAKYVDKYLAELVRRSLPWDPTIKEPDNWKGWDEGGTAYPELDGLLTIVTGRKGRNPYTARTVQKAIRDGTMKPIVDALNTLQRVPWIINKRVKDVVRWASDNNYIVDGVPRFTGLPPIDDLPMPEKGNWETMTAEEQKRWKRKASKIHKRNRVFTSQRALTKIDLDTGERLASHERFWTPMHLDWRGRVLGVPSFNFQRDDRIRALFLFADGQPIGEEGLYWLKVHAANRGDFDKVSKKPFDARVQWVNEHAEEIKSVADDPQKNLWWTGADEPFQFLAACIELSAAWLEGPKFVSQLPISFDGSCNGLQHLAAMTQDDATARLVNLAPSEEPKDIYTAVGDKVAALVNGEASAGNTIAKAWRPYLKDPRKVVKPIVMTYFYGSLVGGAVEQLYADLVQPLENKVDYGELAVSPFGEANGFAAARYLAQHIHDVIETMIDLPAQAREFLQKLAQVMSNNKTYLKWETPTGFPWANRYFDPKEAEQVRLHLHRTAFNVFKDFRLSVSEGETTTINKAGAKNGAAPNLVHACDAAHLAFTVNAAVSEGITSIATVHDCFGCLAAQAGRFREIIREQFVKMYKSNDVLQQVLEQNQLKKLDLNMPSAPPPYGSFKIEEVLKAEYAFS